MDLPRAVLGSLVHGLRPSQAVQPSDMATHAQRRLLALVEGIHADALEPSLPLVSHRAGDDEELAVELAACEPLAVFSVRTLDGLIKQIRRDQRAAALRAGAAALAQGLDRRAVPEAVQDAVRHLAELAKPQDAERGPSHVSVGLNELFASAPYQPLPTGLDALDTLDIMPGHLCVVGARPSVGKTIMLGTLAENAASRGWDCLFLSIEMPRKEIQQRLVASIGNITLDAVRKQSDPAMIAAASKLADLPLWVEDGNDEPPITLDIEGVCALIRLFASFDNGGRPRAVFLDYLQIVHSRKRFDKKFDLVGNTCVELKRCAKECGLVVVAAAQLSRLVEQRGKESIPMLSDLSDSSEIEKSADQIIFIHRKMMEPDGEERNKALLIIAKNRHGPTWRPLVRLAGQFCRFEDVTGGWQ